MTFFGKKKDADIKVRLERKLYLARADPEPVFDLSQCDLKAVPSGIYSLCKVLRKEHLFLQCNQLSRLQDGGNIGDLALIVTLDLSSNKFTSLPQDIHFLKNLKELNLSHNLLKGLPDVVCELTTLNSIDVSFNKLRNLPSSIGNLKNLVIFKAQSNKQLKILPNSLGKLKNSLQLFDVDIENLVYPPRDVSVDSPEAVMKYLAKANELLNGVESNSTDNNDELCREQQKFILMEKQDNLIQAHLKRIEEQKEERLKELMNIEKELQQQKEKELEIQERNKLEKGKLLEDILVQENSLHSKLVKFQVQKDAEKLKLIEHLQRVEDESDRLLEKFLEVSQTLRNPALLEDLDRTQREEMLSLRNQQLRRKEVLEAMERMLAEELDRNIKLINYKHNRESNLRDNLLRLEEMDKSVNKILNDGKNISVSGARWLAQLKKSFGKQGMALGVLLEKTDVQSQALLSELTLVQQQLASLTSVELQRKQLNADQRLNELSSRRIALSELLVDLVNQQDERRKQLLQTLVDVKQKKQIENEIDDDFWLQQYQRLMDQCPESLVCAQRSLDPLLVHFLVQANATHCLPYLASCSLRSISSKKLKEMSVSDDDACAIMHAIEMYKEEKSRYFAPSAPLDDQPGPSAPPEDLMQFSDSANMKKESECNECVICMDKQYQVVFIPCGHLCVCPNCALQLTNCPLCRISIKQKLNVIVP